MPIMLVILAAGKGVRLGYDKPKSLSLIGTEPYLHYQLKHIKEFNIERKILVGGYGIEFLQSFLSEYEHDDVEIHENKEFDKGNIFSVCCVKENIDRDFFLFNADHYYSKENYNKIFSLESSNITIFCDKDRNLTDDDMKVKSVDGQLIEMDKKIREFDCGYVGVTRVPKEKLNDYWLATERVIQDKGEMASVESILNELVKSGEEIKVRDISGSWWTEIDTPEDLIKAKEVISKYE